MDRTLWATVSPDDGSGYSQKAELMCMMETTVADRTGDARTDGKCAESSFAEPALHNFGTLIIAWISQLAGDSISAAIFC